MPTPAENSTSEDEASWRSNLLKLRLNRLDRAIEHLKSYQGEYKSAFAPALNEALAFGFQKSDLAEEFRVSPSTVTRWIDGEACPPKRTRAAIIAKTAALLEAKLVQALVAA